MIDYTARTLYCYAWGGGGIYDTLGGGEGARNKRFHRIVGGEEEGPEEELLTGDASFSARGGCFFFRLSLSRKSLAAPRPLFDSEQLGIRKRGGGGGVRESGEAESCASRDRGGREGGRGDGKRGRGREESTLIRLFGFACLFGKYP